MDFDFVYIIGPGGVKCPFCAQVIPPEAQICSYCHGDLSSSAVWAERLQKRRSAHLGLALGLVISVAIVALFIFSPERDEEYHAEVHPVAAPQAKETTPPSIVPPTPHPAKAAIATALHLYPALGQKDSPMNKTFIGLYEQAKKDNPQSLAVPDWPLTLAAQAAQSTAPKP